MRSLNLKKNTYLVFVLFLFSSLVSCNEKLKPLKKEQSIKVEPSIIQVEVCDPPEQKEADDANILFVLDISGSNVTTDGNRAQRYQNLVNYLSDRINQGKAKGEKYGLIEFSTNNTYYNGNRNYNTTTEDGPFVDINTFQGIVDGQRNGGSADVGGTPYINTFALAKEIIYQDLRARKREIDKDPDLPRRRADYYIFFLSDGQPNGPGDNPEVNIEDAVRGLVTDPLYHGELGKFARRIVMNTGYYHNLAPAGPRELLKRLAQIADGEFFDFTGGKQIDYNEFVNIRTRRVIAENRQWYIQNLNASFSHKTRQLELDSDADGVPDSQEKPLKNSKGEYCMLTPDCDGDGILDGVEALVNEFGVVCDDPTCEPTQAIDLCLLQDGKTFRDSDGDLLPDCWEEELGIHEKESDSNFDGIPDPVAFYAKYFLGQEGLENNPLEADSDNDGLTDMDEIRRGTPYSVHNDYIKGVKPLKFHLTGYNTRKDIATPCEVYIVEDLPVMKDAKDDLVRVILMDQEKFGASKKSMRYAEKKLIDGAVRFTFEDFKDNVPVVDAN